MANRPSSNFSFSVHSTCICVWLIHSHLDALVYEWRWFCSCMVEYCLIFVLFWSVNQFWVLYYLYLNNWKLTVGQSFKPTYSKLIATSIYFLQASLSLVLKQIDTLPYCLLFMHTYMSWWLWSCCCTLCTGFHFEPDPPSAREYYDTSWLLDAAYNVHVLHYNSKHS